MARSKNTGSNKGMSSETFHKHITDGNLKGVIDGINSGADVNQNIDVKKNTLSTLFSLFSFTLSFFRSFSFISNCLFVIIILI